MKEETIVFGGGCFWCTEAVFKMMRGVKSVDPGYAGGTTENPTYEEVSTGKTGHAESVRVVYDPSVVKFTDLLTVFFGSHDPTTLNRQGYDRGTEYRSIVFYTTEAQKQAIQDFIKNINATSKDGDPVVTEVVPLTTFWSAEDYHKDYYAKNTMKPYCQVIINPKLAKVQKEFAYLLNK